MNKQRLEELCAENEKLKAQLKNAPVPIPGESLNGFMRLYSVWLEQTREREIEQPGKTYKELVDLQAGVKDKANRENKLGQ